MTPQNAARSAVRRQCPSPPRPPASMSVADIELKLSALTYLPRPVTFVPDTSVRQAQSAPSTPSQPLRYAPPIVTDVDGDSRRFGLLATPPNSATNESFPPFVNTSPLTSPLTSSVRRSPIPRLVFKLISPSTCRVLWWATTRTSGPRTRSRRATGTRRTRVRRLGLGVDIEPRSLADKPIQVASLLRRIPASPLSHRMVFPLPTRLSAHPSSRPLASARRRSSSTTDLFPSDLALCRLSPP